MGPKVSIVIPSYNYARFLKERLDSITGQSFRNYEIIFLDDGSQDDSLAYFKRYAAGYPEIQFTTLVNSVNSGNPFSQWNKGVALAKGEYIWIAEADDYCTADFLETHVKILDENPNVGIVYCQSCHVNHKSERLGSIIWSVEWLGKQRWQRNFINNGRDEISNYLLFQNTIPNASAVLFRKDIFEKIGQASSEFKLMGDWLTWVRMLCVSDVAFVSAENNFFRVHDSSVRSEFDTQRRLAYIRELYSFAKEHARILSPGSKTLRQLRDHYARISLSKLRQEGMTAVQLGKQYGLLPVIMRYDPFFLFRAVKLMLSRM